MNTTEIPAFDDVDAILTEAVMTRGESLVQLERTAGRPTWRQVKTRNRTRAREAGRCSICTTRPAGLRLDGTPGKTCQPCRERAQAGREARAAARRQAALDIVRQAEDAIEPDAFLELAEVPF